MAWMRKVALGAGVVVLAVAGVAAYLVATFDPNAYKGLLADWVQKEKQRTLSMKGPVSLALWPRVHVKLQDVSLSEFRQSTEFAHLQELDLAVQLMPLLKGQLRVGRVQASGVAVNYRRDAQGRSNIDDLLQAPPKPASEQAGQPLSFDVEGIDLKDVVVQVQDAKTRVAGKLALQQFSSGRLANGVPTDVSLKAQAELSKPQQGTLAVSGQLNLTPDIALMRFAASKLDLALQARLAGGEGAASAQIDAKLKAAAALWDGALASAQASGLDVGLSGQVGQGGSAIVLDKVALTADELALDPSSQAIRLSKLDAQVQAHQGGLARSVALQWPELSVKGDQIKGSALQGRFDVAGPVAVSGSFKSGAPVGSFQAIQLPGFGLDFKVTMAGQGGQREVAGQMQAQVSARPQQLAGALDGLKLQARISEPSLQPLALNAAGHVAATAPTAAEWALKGDINGNAFSTDGKASLGGGAPDVQARAQFVSLDLNRLLPAKAAAATPAAGATGGAAVDQTPVDLSGLRAVNGRFDIRAGQLAWQQYRVADAVILASLKQGSLSLEQLSGAAWGGRFKAQGQAHANAHATGPAGPQAVAMQATADDVDILAVLKDVAGKDMLEGRGNLKLDVRSSGATVGALTAGLGGTASVVLRDGAVKGINLAQSLREAKAKLKLSGQGDAVQKARRTEKTDFTEMTASFQIANGVAHNSDLAAKSPFLRVGGAGNIDLVQRRINYTVNTTVTGTVKGQDGAEIDSLKGLTVPVKLSGPFDALDWKIAWSGVALGSIQNTLKGQVKDKLDAQVKQAGDKLEDQLKAKLLGKPAPAASGASQPEKKPEEVARDKLKDKLKGLFK